VGLFLGLPLLLLALLYLSGGEERERRAALMGKTGAEVRAAYGEPKMIYDDPSEFVEIVKGLEAEGWGTSEGYLPVHGTVWIYPRRHKLSDRCLFIFFDENGRVTRIQSLWW